MVEMSSTFVAQKDIKRRQYIATQVFNSFFYVYSNYVDSNYNTRGTLAVHPQATASNCKAGKILRETGRKLIAGQNPDLTIGANSFTYLVGVFDSSSGLNGFIDPNSPSFAVFNSDKAPFLNVGTEANDGATGLQDLGPSVFTRGPVTTTAISISGSSTKAATGGGAAVDFGSATCGSFTVTTTGTVTLTTTAASTSSRVFLQATNGTPAATTVVATTANTITVTNAQNGVTYNWLLIN